MAKYIYLLGKNANHRNIIFLDAHRKENILDVLNRRPIVGDGSYILTLEKRGYVLGGFWTAEAVVQYPEAGMSLMTLIGRR